MSLFFLQQNEQKSPTSHLLEGRLSVQMWASTVHKRNTIVGPSLSKTRKWPNFGHLKKRNKFQHELSTTIKQECFCFKNASPGVANSKMSKSDEKKLLQISVTKAKPSLVSCRAGIINATNEPFLFAAKRTEKPYFTSTRGTIVCASVSLNGTQAKYHRWTEPLLTSKTQ